MPDRWPAVLRGLREGKSSAELFPDELYDGKALGFGGPRCSEGYAKGNPALNCSPKSYTTERPSPRSGRGRVRRCGGLTPAAVAPRGRVRRAGRRPRRARAAPRGKGACKQVRFSWSTDRPSKGN